MQKILFVSSRHLSKDLLDGAQKRAYEIMKALSNKHKVDFVYCDSRSIEKTNNLLFCNKKVNFKINIFSRIINSINSLLRLEPIQNGFFYSKKMSNFISENKQNYDVIIFHLTRCAQYLPKDFRGKKILEATDLGSENYEQIVKNFSIFNPLKYLYFIEKLLISNYEKRKFNLFDKVVFVSKNELSKTRKILNKRKIINIKNSFKVRKKIFVYKKDNYKILFVGNINYLPNKFACYNFVKQDLPKINEKYPNIQFHIVGKINLMDRFFLKNHNVIIHGPVKKLESVFNRAICGICNLNVATGLQNKIFTYMSYGLPTVISKKSYPQSLIKNNNEVLVYNNNMQLINNIFKLIQNKNLSNKISLNGFNCIRKKFSFIKTYDKYIKIIK